MAEPIWRLELERVTATRRAHETSDELAFGSFVAALCEETEDEFELALQLRAFIESGCSRFIPDSMPEDMPLEN